MIIWFWKTDRTIELHSGDSIQANGHLVIQNAGHKVTIAKCIGPLNQQIFTSSVDPGTTLTFELHHFLPQGKYQLLNNTDHNSIVEIGIKSRKRPTQHFLITTSLKFMQLGKRVKELKFSRPDLDNNSLIQNMSATYINGDFASSAQIQDDLSGKTQKTYSWHNVLQPLFIVLDLEKFAKSYDPHYEEKVVYKDEPGLELSLLPEEIGKEFPDRRYPVLVIKEVHKKIHSEMRYVVQEKERGLSYALRYRRGDCTEYSAYFCSVLRKLGIKARICHGFARSYHNNWISHAFVEVMIFGVWIPVDVMKSPEAIRIGNYGDLIKISHHNWLDSERGRVKVKYTSRGKVKLNMKYQQKVSESGLKNIKKSARVLPEMYKTTITFEKLIDTFNNLTNNGILLILEGDLMATIHTIVMDNGASVPSKTDFQDGVQYFGRIIDNKGEHLFSCRIRRDNSS